MRASSWPPEPVNIAARNGGSSFPGRERFNYRTGHHGSALFCANSLHLSLTASVSHCICLLHCVKRPKDTCKPKNKNKIAMPVKPRKQKKTRKPRKPKKNKKIKKKKQENQKKTRKPKKKQKKTRKPKNTQKIDQCLSEE